MPYLIITAGGEEIDRLELTGDTFVGRSPDCQVALRDVLLSRRHCRIERALGGWRVVDLESRNGTRVNWNKVDSQRLHDGDVLRVGRTLLTFRTGAFSPPPTPPAANRNRLVRPADPFEALAGTVAGFVFDPFASQGDDIPQSPSVRPASPLHDTLLQRDDEPDWARDLPEESAIRAASPRTTAPSGHWTTNPRPQPRLDSAAPTHRVTDLSLQASPELADLPPMHLTRLSRMSDTAVFMSIFITVSTLITGGIIAGMYMLTR